MCDSIAHSVSRLARPFFRHDPVAVARSLLGQRLVRVLDDGTRLAGIIVETEAYLGEIDRAAHTWNGRRTPRNESMWRDGGHAYVYFTYGMHFCMNVVTQTSGRPTAVLLRALEPVEGLPRMREMRGRDCRRETDLCSGPAKLCQAMSIDRNLDGVDLTTSEVLFIEQVRKRCLPRRLISVTPRIGVAYAGAWARKPLRFHIAEHAHVSGR